MSVVNAWRGRKRERPKTAHAGLRDSDLAPFRALFPRSLVRRFNFIAKTERLHDRFGLPARVLRSLDYVVLSAVPPLRRYCTAIVCRFEKESETPGGSGLH